MLAFERSKNGEKVIYMANLSDKPVNFYLELTEELQPYLGKKELKKEKNDQYHFAPWEYVILANN
ncbi:MAG: hypothetical protein R3259_11720 [Salinimicrobium sediminis]|nr:hypothetical protein [Salinimicrobium sediminis]